MKVLKIIPIHFPSKNCVRSPLQKWKRKKQLAFSNFFLSNVSSRSILPYCYNHIGPHFCCLAFSNVLLYSPIHIFQCKTSKSYVSLGREHTPDTFFFLSRLLSSHLFIFPSIFFWGGVHCSLCSLPARHEISFSCSSLDSSKCLFFFRYIQIFLVYS